MSEPSLEIVQRSLAQILPDPNNPRNHSPKQVKQIAASIREFGWTQPILIDEDGVILAGHGRHLAAQHNAEHHEQPSEAPVVILSNLTDKQKRAYRIADNRLAEGSSWNVDLLRQEMEALVTAMPDEPEFDIDPTITGFDMGAIDMMLAPQDDIEELPSEAIEDVPPVPVLGELWAIGEHRLFVGDSTKAASYQTLLGDTKARLVLTDPPYNVTMDSMGVDNGGKHTDFAMAQGEMSQAEFTDFLQIVWGHLRDHTISGGMIYAFMDWRHLQEISAAYESISSEILNIAVWVKTNPGMGSFYRSQHELCLVGKSGKGAHINNVQLGVHGRNRTNVWTYAGFNTGRPDARAALSMHPTVKPVGLLKEAILDVTNIGDAVLDPFGGSGSTLVAAHQASRVGYAIEMVPHYADVILRRMARETAEEPVCLTTNETYDVRRKKLKAAPTAAKAKNAKA